MKKVRMKKQVRMVKQVKQVRMMKVKEVRMVRRRSNFSRSLHAKPKVGPQLRHQPLPFSASALFY